MVRRRTRDEDSGPGVDYSTAPPRGQPGFVDWWIQNTGQLFTPDPLHPGTFYQDDPNVSGGIQRIDSRGNVLTTYGPAGPLSQGGAGFDITHTDPTTGGPARLQYPTEQGGFMGLGDVGGSLAAIATLAAIGASAGTLAGPVAAGTAGTAATVGAGATLGSAGLTVANQAAQNAELQKAALALGLAGGATSAVGGIAGAGSGALQGPTLSGATLDTVGTGSGSLASGLQTASPYVKAGGTALKGLGALTGNAPLSLAGQGVGTVGGVGGADSGDGALGSGLSWGDLAKLGITGAGVGALAAGLSRGGSGSTTSPGTPASTGRTTDMATTSPIIGQPGTQPDLSDEDMLAQLRRFGVESLQPRQGLYGAGLTEAEQAANASSQRLLTGLRSQITQLRQGLQGQFAQASRALGPAGSKLIQGAQGSALGQAGAQLSSLLAQGGSQGQSQLLSVLQGLKPGLVTALQAPQTTIAEGPADFSGLTSLLTGAGALNRAIPGGLSNLFGGTSDDTTGSDLGTGGFSPSITTDQLSGLAEQGALNNIPADQLYTLYGP